MSQDASIGGIPLLHPRAPRPGGPSPFAAQRGGMPSNPSAILVRLKSGQDSASWLHVQRASRRLMSMPLNWHSRWHNRVLTFCRREGSTTSVSRMASRSTSLGGIPLRASQSESLRERRSGLTLPPSRQQSPTGMVCLAQTHHCRPRRTLASVSSECRRSLTMRSRLSGMSI